MKDINKLKVGDFVIDVKSNVAGTIVKIENGIFGPIAYLNTEHGSFCCSTNRLKLANSYLQSRLNYEHELRLQQNKDIDEFCRNLCRERQLNGNNIATFEDLLSYINKIKAEACKEFAERLKQHKRKMRGFDLNEEFWDYAVLIENIDNLLKEMIGEEE